MILLPGVVTTQKPESSFLWLEDDEPALLLLEDGGFLILEDE